MIKKIIPAILPKDFLDLKNHLERIKNVTDFVQIDICNNTYTPSKTWPFTHTPDIYFEKMITQEEGMPLWKEIDFELDLMINNPEKFVDDFINLGPARIIFHFETLQNPLYCIKTYKEKYPLIEFGIAFSNNTNAEEQKETIEIADIVQCMGIDKIGFQGQDFDQRVLDQVKKIRKISPEKIIAVDGAVNEDTISELSNVGVNHFVTGSAFFNTDNLISTLKKFQKLTQD